MQEYLTRNWWLLALRGVAAMVFGLLTFFWPVITLLAMVLLFGAYALVDGVAALVSALRGGRGGERLLLLLEGIAGVTAGILTFFWPGITALALLYLIAAWAAVTGAFEIMQAVRLRRDIEGEWMLGLAGVMSVLFGLGIAVFPLAGAVAVAWLIGAFAVAFGALLLGLGLSLRDRQQPPQELRQAA